MDQRAGDAPRSGGRSPAIAADGPSPSEDAATEEADGAPSPARPSGSGPRARPTRRAPRRGGRQRRRRRRKEKQESGRSSLPGTEEGKAALQGRAEREGRAGQRPRRAQESARVAILASRKSGEDASRRVPYAGRRGRSDAGHARLRDSSVRAHGTLARYSSLLDTRQQRQGGRERFEPNGPGSAKREYDDEDGSLYQDRVPGRRRWPRFEPPELGTQRHQSSTAGAGALRAVWP
ncbi:hypothetical protein THAOC_32247 [Thalassiosira oceanica]|uniref:Uncharacterized protein n=1 Tax=Thalassiosira oceanica TaxID=159749 RepID=K0R6E1_THAOC|nr:hypothetical protein THAOC_32247 [Thalassiosira oceanica]|eukprot:EJK48918.1 hypothetical protein THAOC_32247 [Thalassiosira oceanica]